MTAGYFGGGQGKYQELRRMRQQLIDSGATGKKYPAVYPMRSRDLPSHNQEVPLFSLLPLIVAAEYASQSFFPCSVCIILCPAAKPTFGPSASAYQQ
jgi:hypothetical protein